MSRKMLAALSLGAALSLASPILSAGAAVPAPPTLAPILAAVSPGVVNIAVEGTVASRPNPLMQDPFFRQFFGNGNGEGQDQPQRQKFQAVGSGVIVDAANGYVLTNNHVIEHADKIVVRLKDRREVRAKLVGADPQTDIAVLKISADHLTAVPEGQSGPLQVGDYVVALGDPFGIGQTATFGIVSALGRTGLGIEGYENFIQTDAAINPGNSGGALIGMDGKLIGINTAILTGGQGGGNVGVGFAIPIDMAKQVADQLIAHGKIERGQLGVQVEDLTPDTAKVMGLSVDTGALVSRVVRGSPADKAGIKAGDVVTALNDQALEGSADLRNRIGLIAPGSSVKLSVIRKKETKTISVTLEKASAETASAAAGDQSVLEGVQLSSGRDGVSVTAIDRNSRAYREGVRRGDVIVGADQQAVHSAEQLAAIQDQNDGEPLVLDIKRGDDQIVLVLQ
jgi:serine protease Do/serine protease DegQ